MNFKKKQTLLEKKLINFEAKIGNLFNRKLSEPQILTGDISITNDSKTAKNPSKKRRPQSNLVERE